MMTSGLVREDGVTFAALAALVLLAGVFGGAVLGVLAGFSLLDILTACGGIMGVMLCTDEEAEDRSSPFIDWSRWAVFSSRHHSETVSAVRSGCSSEKVDG